MVICKNHSPRNRLFGEVADSRAEAGLIEDKPKASCHAGKQGNTNTHTQLRGISKGHRSRLEELSMAKDNNVNDKIIKGVLDYAPKYIINIHEAILV